MHIDAPARPAAPAPTAGRVPHRVEGSPRPPAEPAPAAEEAELVQVFKLLADETRLKVLMALLRGGESHVSGLCRRLDQSQPAVSHHLALLRQADLIQVRREGKHNFYSVRKPHFERVMGDLFGRMMPEPSLSA